MTDGQSFIDAQARPSANSTSLCLIMRVTWQDELSVLEFMEKYGMPKRINDEIFIAMGKVITNEITRDSII